MAHVSGSSGTVWAADPATGGDFCTATAHDVGHFILLPLAICHAGHDENGANVVASQKQRSAYIYMMNTSNSNSSNT